MVNPEDLANYHNLSSAGQESVLWQLEQDDLKQRQNALKQARYIIVEANGDTKEEIIAVLDAEISTYAEKEENLFRRYYP